MACPHFVNNLQFTLDYAMASARKELFKKIVERNKPKKQVNNSIRIKFIYVQNFLCHKP